MVTIESPTGRRRDARRAVPSVAFWRFYTEPLLPLCGYRAFGHNEGSSLSSRR